MPLAERRNLAQYKYISEWPAGTYPGADDVTGKLVASFQNLLDEEFPLPDWQERIQELTAELACTLISKQIDYGPRAINEAPGGPLFGVLVRIHDKYERLRNLIEAQTDPAVVEEALTDTLLDLAGYGVIGTMVLEGSWPR